jgi:hypothetical protein
MPKRSARRSRLPKESVYYPQVQSFLESLDYVCESIGRNRKPIPFITKGIGQIIIDVFGIKAAKSQFSTEIEVMAVEVKRSTRRASLRFMMQAFNNSRMAHYCYLAMPHRYTDKEVASAAELGIGLLEIRKTNIRLVAQSRRFQPSGPLLREFLRKNLAIAQCSVCENFTSLYDIPEGQMREGGGWRQNVFAGRSRWVYFCKQCRERFENAFSERRMVDLVNRIRKLEQRHKLIKGGLRAPKKRG